MAEPNVERRLAAILAADVVGYSRLMEANEERTMAALKQHRREFFDPTMEKHGGRIFKVMGDGFLVEFGSVVGAVQCAVDIQAQTAARNHAVPEDQRIIFRIGVNLGDVIVDGADLYGDGVNVAARLEGLADPGGICLSAKAHQEVHGKVDAHFTDCGEQVLKNITQAVRVYKTSPGALQPNPVARARPGKASIAVLAFRDMNGDAAQDYFAEGIAEDVLTELSRFPSLFVIARNSSFSFKGQDVAIAEIARLLGVAFVLTGSVRRGGNRVRVAAQLVQAET